MLLKQSTIIICSSSNLPTFIWPSASTTSWGQTLQTTQQSDRKQQVRSARRTYATVHKPHRWRHSSENPPSHHDWPSCPNPTPYQVFNQTQHDPYNKTRFYELVKLYHPDRRHVHHHALSHRVCIERYRLIVQANEILSDPAKKRAYDLYGFGWGAMATLGNNAVAREADRDWRTRPGNASMNATWEDWERWYEAHTGEKQQKQRPVYISNELFVAILCAFVVFGSMGQARRASSRSANILDMREREHQNISYDLRQRQMETAGQSRHERVESFLRQREGWDLATRKIETANDGGLK